MLRICVFYALIIFRHSFFFQKLAYKYAKSVFIHSVVLKCERIDFIVFKNSVSDCFCTFCKFQPKPLPFTAYQECKPVQSSTRQLRKQHAYLPPCSDIIYSAVSLLWAHNKR